jgi:hypothetical protein
MLKPDFQDEAAAMTARRCCQTAPSAGVDGLVGSLPAPGKAEAQNRPATSSHVLPKLWLLTSSWLTEHWKERRGATHLNSAGQLKSVPKVQTKIPWV